jgi:hypothetical protein
MASNKRQIIESSDVEISIKSSVRRSSNSKIIFIDHDIVMMMKVFRGMKVKLILPKMD